MTISCATSVDHRFAIQQTNEQDWLRATSVNLAADFLNGGHREVQEFIAQRPVWATFGEQILGASRADLTEYVESGVHESLIFLVLMMTGACNANCPICFTDRRRKRDELSPPDRDHLLAQAKALGCHYVYVPGEGEPTIDRGWWHFLETCRKLDLHAIVFTNGMVFSDDRTTRHYWQMTRDEAAAAVGDYPVSFYYKYWSMTPEKQARMMKVKPDRLDFQPYGRWSVPSGLIRLIETLPRDRVGVEICVERRNADEAVNQLVPFTDEYSLSRVIELIQHNGRTFGDPSFDPTIEQANAVRPFLSPTSCTMATCKAVVTVQGYLSPRIAVLEHQLSGLGEPVHVSEGPLFDLLHQTEYLVARRYDLDCLCETLPLGLARANGRVAVQVTSVVPPALKVGRVDARSVVADDMCGCGAGATCCRAFQGEMSAVGDVADG
jgi:hypothetical protein